MPRSTSRSSRLYLSRKGISIATGRFDRASPSLTPGALRSVTQAVPAGQLGDATVVMLGGGGSADLGTTAPG